MEAAKSSNDDREVNSESSDADNVPPDNVPPDGKSPATDNQPRKQHAHIDKLSGICDSCDDADTMNTALSCMFCQESFHAVCRDAQGDKTGTDIICTRSFFNQYDKVAGSEGVYKSRPGNFAFICDVCMTNFEQKNAATQENKVDVIDRRVDELAKGMKEMKGLLNKIVEMKCPDKPAVPQPHTLSYSNVVQSGLKRSVLVVGSNLSDSEQSDSGSVEKIITENSIHVDNRYLNSKGDTVFVCPTEKDRKTLSDKLSAKFPQVNTFVPPERLPTISVANLPTQYEEKQLKDMILKAHPNIELLVQSGETFDVLKVKKQVRNPNKYQASIRVSNNIRKIIERQENRLYIESYSCRVFDHFHIKRCNNCQKYNHYSSECKAEKPSCGHCSGNHHSDKCEHMKKDGFFPCCTNCKSSKHDSEKRTHSAFHRNCPSYRAEQTKLMHKISYYNVSKNSHPHNREMQF